MKRFVAGALGVLAVVVSASFASAKVATRSFDYKEGDTILGGFIAYDDAKKGKRPAVLMFAQYTGFSEHERTNAVALAKLGYVVMVADVYGKGINPPAPKAAAEEMGKYTKNRPLLRARAKAGLERLLSERNVDPARIAAVGYCFGGAGALELGRQGADVKAIVSLHGTLWNPTPADAANIKSKVLILHGADDPAVAPAEVDAFKAEMKDANIDLTFVAYSQTRHSFSIATAGNDNTKNSAYNERSAKRAFAAMSDFLQETVGR